jgi:hypothetical protein
MLKLNDGWKLNKYLLKQLVNWIIGIQLKKTCWRLSKNESKVVIFIINCLQGKEENEKIKKEKKKK